MDLLVIDRKAKDNSNYFGCPEDGSNMKSNVTVFKSFKVLSIENRLFSYIVYPYCSFSSLYFLKVLSTSPKSRSNLFLSLIRKEQASNQRGNNKTK